MKSMFDANEAEDGLIGVEMISKSDYDLVLCDINMPKMDGVEVFGKTGAMYLFPRLSKLPAGTDDFDYCMALLEETGLCTVNGSGFGLKNHLRIAFLPSKEQLEEVLPRWVKFHNEYVNR